VHLLYFIKAEIR